MLLGVAASPGLGVGTVVQVRHEDFEVTEDSNDRHRERRRLNDAIDRSSVQLEALQDRLTNEADADKAAIFAAHREILRDPDLMDLAMSGIDKGKTAEFAWRRAYQNYADRLAALKNEVFAGRATDVRDVGQRVLQEITGQRREQAEIPAGSILVAEDLTPSDTVALDPTKVVGFCTTAGGASSHVAILARALDIPAVAGIDPRVLDIADGTRVILDGANGTLRMNVTEEQVERIRRRQAKHLERRAVELAHADERADTTDGHHMEVVANIGGLDDALAAMDKGAEGVGLLRSEFVFLERRSAPSEDEQASIYTEIARALRPGQPLVIRTLDVGGDKPLPYLPIAQEENPFLGMRGIRVGLDRPEILRTQVRAILRSVDAGAKINVMFPMIATIEDFRLAKAIFEEERAGLGVEPGPGRDHGRGAVGRGDGRAVRRRGGLLLRRHQRSDAVHAGHGPRPPQARPAGGRAQPGGARLDRTGGHRGPRGREVGRGLRWHRVRPAGRPAAGRPRRRRTVRQRPGHPRRQGADPLAVPRRTARNWPPAPSPRTPPPRSAPSCRPTTTRPEPGPPDRPRKEPR